MSREISRRWSRLSIEKQKTLIVGYKRLHGDDTTHWLAYLKNELLGEEGSQYYQYRKHIDTRFLDLKYGVKSEGGSAVEMMV